MQEAMIEVRGLKKNYGDFAAVDGISFDVRKGEIFGFLGPNGAGKTTTINMLIGLARITEGRVFYRGEDRTASIKKAQSLIGVVPDDSNLYDDMSGFDNLVFCGALYGLPKALRETRARAMLEEFQLSAAAEKPFRAFSKGMKRKLTIAAALMHEPEILFLDEPTTGIDIVSVRQIRALIKELNRKGTTIFLTTHYIEEAERLCDRVAFIDKGKIARLDTVENLVAETQDSSVVEVSFETVRKLEAGWEARLRKTLPLAECSFSGANILRVQSSERLDIAPVVSFLAAEGLVVYEARLVRPTLEDAFVKFAGIEADALKKEKEKR